jgi:hypothetical protein
MPLNNCPGDIEAQANARILATRRIAYAIEAFKYVVEVDSAYTHTLVGNTNEVIALAVVQLDGNLTTMR